MSRKLAGVAALSFPVVLIVLAVNAGFRHDGDYADFAASFVATLLLLIAEPTAWLFSFDFIDAGRFTIIFVGALTSLPLWFLVGWGLTADSPGWPVWIRRYVIVCLGWTVLNLAVIFLVSALVG